MKNILKLIKSVLTLDIIIVPAFYNGKFKIYSTKWLVEVAVFSF